MNDSVKIEMKQKMDSYLKRIEDIVLDFPTWKNLSMAPSSSLSTMAKFERRLMLSMSLTNEILMEKVVIKTIKDQLSIVEGVSNADCVTTRKWCNRIITDLSELGHLSKRKEESLLHCLDTMKSIQSHATTRGLY